MNDDLISREALKKALEVTQYNDIDDLTRTERLIDNAQPVDRPQGDLISRSALRKDIERLYSVYKDNKDYFYTDVLDHIDNAPPVEVPENTVNCVLTMFGKCSYNKTGCSDCEIKDKIRKALNARSTGEWIIDGHHYKCSRCGKTLAIMFSETDDDDLIGCPFCLADMRVKDELGGKR